MNILYLISYAGKAGTEKYVENLMRTYSAQGHRCFLAYMDGGELAEKAKALGCGVFWLDLRAAHALAAAKSIARLCAENGIVLCDAYAHWKAMYRSGLDTTELLVNRINHPRAEMHDVFAQMLTDIIENI